jgi:hypothetical protein
MGEDVRRLAVVALGMVLVAASPAQSALKRAAPPSDLTGVWTHAWYTRLQRPTKAFKAIVATPYEAEAYEAPRRALKGALVEKEDTLGQAQTEFPDNGPGLARIRGEIRAAWIVDPPDGRLPWKPEGKKRVQDADKGWQADFDNVEARDTEERCITGPGGGAPLLNTHDGNVLNIVQTRDWLAIVSEKANILRVVPIGPGKPGLAPGEWAGDAAGHWEGRTLVVETRGLRAGLTKISDDLSLTETARVVERFTRTGPREITYAFQVEDPALFTRAWKAEMVFRAGTRIFEYACHEGNYSLPSILAGARQAEHANGGGGK